MMNSMVTVRQAIDQLEMLLDMKIVKPTDVLVVIGTGDKKSRFLSSISATSIEFKNVDEVVNDSNGYYHIGFNDVLKDRYYEPKATF